MILQRIIYRAKWKYIKIYLPILIFTCILINYLRFRPTEYVPKHLHKYLKIEDNYVVRSGIEPAALQSKVKELNEEREVQNWAIFGPVHADSAVLAVRVGRDPQRLQLLVLALAQVDNIGSAVVVFSHSFYDEAVNDLVQSITFCMVLQIYFPNSAQLSRGVSRLAETKHHWWWTAHVLFEQVEWAAFHRGMVAFLEEDDYVLPDFMHMLEYAQSALASVPEAQLLAFGRTLARNLDRDKLTVDSWRPPYDRGLTFNKSTWEDIKMLTNQFCEYDDTSWSYSLLHALKDSPRGHAVMVACMAPRVISTGTFDSGRQALENMYELSQSEGLFPAQVFAVALYSSEGRIYRRLDVPRGNGGWSDLRDQLLCLDPMTPIDADYDYRLSVNAPPSKADNKASVP